MDELISPDDLRRRQQGDDPPLVIDVRGSEEYAGGHLPGARWTADLRPTRGL
jgi:rhodanese-related sulfurtransferase